MDCLKEENYPEFPGIKLRPLRDGGRSVNVLNISKNFKKIYMLTKKTFLFEIPLTFHLRKKMWNLPE